jgi:outer membrane protein assembly factor BamB
MKLLTFVGLLSLLALSACHKSAVKPSPIIEGPPGIYAATVTDYCSGIVTIKGADFDSIASKDTVFFGTKMVTPVSAADTQLVVLLPFNYAGTLTVHCNGYTANGLDSIIWEKPVIDSVKPALAGTGTIITIYGRYFNRDASGDSIYFNHIPAQVLGTGPGFIQTIVPPGATTGTVTVHTFCQLATSPSAFVNSNKGTIYLTTNSNALFALDVASGGQKFTFTVESAGLAYSHGVLYFGNSQDNNFYAVDALTGKQIWDFPAVATLGPPAIAGDTIFVGSYNNNLYAIDTSGNKLWSTNLGYDGGRSPWYFNGALYLPNQAYLDVVNASNGTLNWRKYIFPRNPTVVNGIVYVEGFDSTGEQPLVYAFDAATGNTLWTYNLVEDSPGSSAVANGLVFVSVSNQPIRALNAATGQLVWTSVNMYSVSSAMEISNNILYVTSGALICALDCSSGNLLWSAPLDPQSDGQGSPTVANAVVYVGSWGGGVYAFNASTGQPIWKSSAGASPILSGPVIVDSSGNVFYSGNVINQP